MPKNTFNNLSEHRQKEIIDACIEEFKEKPITEASVVNITNRLSLARSAFYKYFSNIEECYFYILHRENLDLHRIFIESLEDNNGDIEKTLKDYFERITEILFDSDMKKLFRNFILYKNKTIDEKWEMYKSDGCKGEKFMSKSIDIIDINLLNIDSRKEIKDVFVFLQSVVHEITRQAFTNDWEKEEFVYHYNLIIKWCLGGIVRK